MTTIYDVAAYANVSISTVSRVLNNPAAVRSATRMRVIAAIDTLGFVPVASAATRARRSTRRIGVLAPLFTRPAFTSRLRGVTQQLAGIPAELVVSTIESAEHRDASLARLDQRELDGLIIMSTHLETDMQSHLAQQAFPTVLIEHPSTRLSTVEIDDREGGALAAHYLVDRGHRHIGFVGDAHVASFVLHVSIRRQAGFVAALAERGITLDPLYIACSDHSLANACADAHRLLSLPVPPTAIFAASDTQAMGVLHAARERGLRVPEDIAVIGFDDIDIAAYIGLTTIRQHLEESGRVAVDILMARIDASDRLPHRVHLPLELVLRSTA